MFEHIPNHLKNPIPVFKDDPGKWIVASRQITVDAIDEPLVRADQQGLKAISYYAITDGSNSPYNKPIPNAMKHVWVRLSAIEICKKADEQLSSYGFNLILLDGYRSIETQQALWNHFEDVIFKDKGLTGEALENEVRKYVSDPRRFNINDPTTWPVHACGGAIDLWLQDTKTGKLVDLGIGFDDATDWAQTDYYERLLAERKIDENDPVLLARRILYNVMIKAGARNYPGEIWHYGIPGDKFFAQSYNSEYPDRPPIKAVFGYVASPEHLAA